jgi:integrase
MKIIPEKGFKITSKNLMKSLNREGTRQLLDIVRPGSENNPWLNEGVCYRNQLIVHMLLYTDCGRNELLNIKLTDFDHDEMSIKICIDSYNPSTHSRALKNFNRKIMIPDAIYQMSGDYIMRFLSTSRVINKSLNLFTSHGKGEPLSLSSLNNIFNLLTINLGFKVTYNTLLHTWKVKFSKHMEHYQNYLMGCELDSSQVEFITKDCQMLSTTPMIEISPQLQNKKHISGNK